MHLKQISEYMEFHLDTFDYSKPLPAILVDRTGKEVEKRQVLKGAIKVQALRPAGHGRKVWQFFERTPAVSDGCVVFVATDETRAWRA